MRGLATSGGGAVAALLALALAGNAQAGVGRSTNWAGYVLPSTRVVTAVGGAWTVPALDCSGGSDTSASIWVGIGGDAGPSDPLLQTGVETDCVDGSQVSWGWWEEYPTDPDESYAFRGFPVAAGDAIRATVHRRRDGHSWETRLDDLTTGRSGVAVTGRGWGVLPDAVGRLARQGPAPAAYPGGRSAEWVVEDPASADDGSTLPFADFGAVTFADPTASVVPWRLTADDGVELVQDGVVLAAPATPTGNGFVVGYSG